MNINYKNLKLQFFDDIGLLSINRPTKLNSLNQEVLKELRILLREILQDKDFKIKGLIFTGEGDKAFIAGADIAEISKMNEKEANEFALLGQHVTLLFEKIGVPVIAAVQGYALGGGLEMAMSCDFIFSTRNAVFGLPEVKLGLIPGFGGTQRLSRFIGRQKAKDMIFTGKNLTADEALKLGLVLQIYENKDDMIKGALEKIGEMKKNSPFAIGGAKKVMNLGNDLPLSDGLNLELDQFSLIFNSEDMKEGTKAFIEKRSPNFVGR